MKNTLLLLVVVVSSFLCGCEEMGMVRANPVALKINGTYFQSNPDTTSVFDQKPEFQASFTQMDESFIFHINESLYSKRRECHIEVKFSGDGSVGLNQRYPLLVQEGEQAPFLTLDGRKYEITDGWVEFGEYGINEISDVAYTSGTLGLTVENEALTISAGTFGRMLECRYYDRRTLEAPDNTENPDNPETPEAE